jgi:GNAT superfamily N-acetyltransferase
MNCDSPDMPPSVQLSSFELVARDINDVDIDHLHALTISVRWPHRQKDWAFLRQVGRGIAAVDEIGRVFGSAMWFPQGEDFATIGLVITTPRAQAKGGGRWLMEQLLARCGKRNLALNSTHAAYPLYVSLGFSSEGVVNMRQGEVQATLPHLPDISGVISELPRDRVAELFALDARAFGHDRSEMLVAFAELSSILVLWRGGKVVGYSMCREFGRGHQVGPTVAFDSADAAHLTAAHLGSLPGRFARVDTREKDGLFADFLERCGLHIAETVTTMSKGRRFLHDRIEEPRVFGLAGHAVG